MGALRCGAGLVFLGVPESIYSIEAVEFYLGDNLMEYKKDGTGDVRFEGNDFLLPLTQKMTFALRSAPVPLYIRVKEMDGSVIGLDKVMVQVVLLIIMV